MNATHEARGRALSAQISDLVIKGRVEEVLLHAKAIEEWLEGARDDVRSPIVERLRAAWAQSSLVMIDRRQAEKALEPYLRDRDSGGQLLEKADDPDSKKFVPSFGRGAVLMAIANLRYREFELHESERIAASAAAHLQHPPDAPADLELLLARSQNAIWRARVLWHAHSQVEAKQCLASALGELARELDGTGELRGVELLAALAYGLWAQWDWRMGRIGKAKEKVYHALFLLRGLKDDAGNSIALVRTAHILMAAGQIERSFNHPELRWAKRLLRESAELFRVHSHPFEARARIQLARCYMTHGSMEELAIELERVDALQRKLESTDSKEAAFVYGDLVLTKLWPLEERARAGHVDSWKECAERARLLDRPAETILRFEIEQDIHFGLATAMQGSEESRASGRKRLEQALRKARNKEPILAISAKLALCEANLEVNKATSFQYWEEATFALSAINSASLMRWKEYLATKLNAPLSVQINLNLGFKDAQRQFVKSYLQYQVARHVDRGSMLSALRLSSSHFYRLLADYGIEVPSEWRKTP